MAGRIRSTKKLAERIDREYFKRLYPIPRWRRILSFALSAIGLAWVGSSIAGSGRVFNAGPLSRAHRLLEANCTACHAVPAAFGRETSAQACLACHDGPAHTGQQTFAPSCMSCHVEHRGADRLAAVDDVACTQCHARLQSRGGKLNVAADITGFDAGHPEFAVLRAADPGTVKFNHEVHMKAGLRSPTGPTQLVCASCHTLQVRDGRLGPDMSTADFEQHCERCHRLEFHRRIDQVLPHGKPEAALAFAREALSAYIAAHPGDVNLIEPPLDPRILSPRPGPAGNAGEWIRRAMEDTETLMWRKSCIECHTPEGRQIPGAGVRQHWLNRTPFDHATHQLVACTECHRAAVTSKAASDILLPGIATCRQCHRTSGAAAGARCSDCHLYHDWPKAGPVNSKTTIRDLLLR